MSVNLATWLASRSRIEKEAHVSSPTHHIHIFIGIQGLFTFDLCIRLICDVPNTCWLVNDFFSYSDVGRSISHAEKNWWKFVAKVPRDSRYRPFRVSIVLPVCCLLHVITSPHWKPSISSAQIQRTWQMRDVSYCGLLNGSGGEKKTFNKTRVVWSKYSAAYTCWSLIGLQLVKYQSSLSNYSSNS